MCICMCIYEYMYLCEYFSLNQIWNCTATLLYVTIAIHWIWMSPTMLSEDDTSAHAWVFHQGPSPSCMSNEPELSPDCVSRRWNLDIETFGGTLVPSVECPSLVISRVSSFKILKNVPERPRATRQTNDWLWLLHKHCSWWFECSGCGSVFDRRSVTNNCKHDRNSCTSRGSRRLRF